MCRLVGIVASEITEFGLCLKEAPRSLAMLSREHPDGWGVATFEHGREGWRVEKGIERAYECHRFHALARSSAGHVLIAHVRQKTVGKTSIENTHPFQQSGWIFAHNGTVKDIETVRAGASKARLAEITGDTDSEVLFAHLLTRLDEAGLTNLAPSIEARAAATIVIEETTKTLRDANVGAFNFLLSNGKTLFAHRFGRSLYLLERSPNAAGTEGWTQRRHAVLIASERITPEAWREIPEGTLIRVDREPTPSIVERTPPAPPVRAA